MKSILVALTIIFLSAILYALTLRGVPGNPPISRYKDDLDHATKPFELSPERARFVLTRSLAENKSFSLSPALTIAATPDVGYNDGKFFILFAPGVSVLALPLYLLGNWLGVAQVASFATISIFAIGNLLLIYLISKKIFKRSDSTAILSALIFGFASTSWSYAITLYQHHVTLFFILSGFFSAWHFKTAMKYKWLYSLYVWFAYGMSIFFDYPNIILLTPVMAYHLLSAFDTQKLATKLKLRFNFSYLLTSIIFVLLISLHGFYNNANFGSPTKLSGSILDYQEYQKQKKGLLKEEAHTEKINSFFQETQFPSGLSILTAGDERGIFRYSPIFFLAVIGILFSLSQGKQQTENHALLGIAFVNLFLYSSWGDPWGGWAYGPRYLIPTMAVLSLFIGVLLQKIKNGWRSILLRIATAILFAYSSAVALLGAITSNANPPKVEAKQLIVKLYDPLLNIKYFNEGKSGSYLYNSFLAKYMSLQEFALIIWSTLMIFALILLFIVPLFEKSHAPND